METVLSCGLCATDGRASDGSPKVKKTKTGKKWLEPYEVEIGRLTKSDGGGGPKVIVTETETTMQVADGPTVSKQDLADICDCGVGDKCWATALCEKPWALKLHMCNHVGEAGHEYYDSDQHVFTKEQILMIRAHKESLVQASENRLATEE